jgi:small multidrug resistance pump
MHWIYLTLAILFEVAGTTCMKLSSGFARILPTALMALFYACSFGCMTLAIKRIDLSVAYAVWSGFGVALIAAIGIWQFREPLTLLKLVGTAAIIVGVIALNIGRATH